jgi:hypothetical protein
MEVTPIGWLLLLAGPVLMILRPKWLRIAAIFSLPFTATAVINVGSGVDSSSVQAPMYFGMLLLLRYCIASIRKLSFSVPRIGRWPIFYLGLFIAVATFSLIVPWWLGGQITVPPLRLGDSETILHLNSSHFTHLLYIIFGFAYAYLIAVLNQRPARLLLTLKSFIAGAAFASCWALMEFACKLSGVKYPAMIFNTGKAVSTRGYLEYSGGLPRLASVAVEPSILGETLLIAIAILMPYVFGAPVLFSKKKDRAIFALITLVLCLSTSSTAYLGLFVLILTSYLLFSIRGALKLKYIVWPGLAAATAVLLYITVPIVQAVLNNQLFSKSESGSALERAWTVTNAYAVFLQYPILGVGWSSVASYDLVMNILANTGIVGLLSFTAAMYAMFRLLYCSIKSRDRALKARGILRVDFAAYIALAVSLSTALISGIPFVFTYFWFVFGLAVAAAGAMHTLNEESSQRTGFPLRRSPAPGI